MKSTLSDKYVKKYMRMVNFLAEENTLCYSRKIGCLICDDRAVIKAIGINGPARGVPHTDSYIYLRDYLWPKLTVDERSELTNYVVQNYHEQVKEIGWNPQEFVSKSLDGCGICPRKLLKYKSGEGSDRCGCIHAEINCIINSTTSVRDGILFCSCENLSCINCTSVIINSGIREVHFMFGVEYQNGALWLYEKAGIPVFRHSIEEVDE